MRIAQQPTIIKALAVLLFFIFAALGYFAFSRDAQPVVNNTATESAQEPRVVEDISYIAEPGASALDQLAREATIETKESAYGTLVERINGAVNGTDGKYWLFYVDGKMADKGADAYISTGGETIVWKFSK